MAERFDELEHKKENDSQGVGELYEEEEGDAELEDKKIEEEKDVKDEEEEKDEKDEKEEDDAELEDKEIEEEEGDAELDNHTYQKKVYNGKDKEECIEENKSNKVEEIELHKIKPKAINLKNEETLLINRVLKRKHSETEEKRLLPHQEIHFCKSSHSGSKMYYNDLSSENYNAKLSNPNSSNCNDTPYCNSKVKYKDKTNVKKNS